jgi:hypothetical protein
VNFGPKEWGGPLPNLPLNKMQRKYAIAYCLKYALTNTYKTNTMPILIIDNDVSYIYTCIYVFMDLSCTVSEYFFQLQWNYTIKAHVDFMCLKNNICICEFVVQCIITSQVKECCLKYKKRGFSLGLYISNNILTPMRLLYYKHVNRKNILILQSVNTKLTSILFQRESKMCQCAIVCVHLFSVYACQQ